MKLSNILNNAFRLTQTAFGLQLLGTFILFATVFIVYSSLLTTLFGMPIENIAELYKEPETLQRVVTQQQFIIKFWLFSLLIDGMITPFTAGLYKNYSLIAKGEKPTLSNFFHYYRAPETATILMHVILQMCLKTFVFVGLISAGAASLGLALSTVFSLVFVLTIPIVIFEGKSLFRAMRESYQRIMSAPFTALIVTTLGMFLLMAGLFSMLIGIVITFPFLFAGIFSMYQSTTINN